LSVLVLAGSSGCGGKHVYPVEGQVVFKDGTPLAGGWVVFEPMDPEVKASASGDIRSDGTFRLATHKNADGAFEGRYRVVVTPPLTKQKDERKPVPETIHSKYLSLDTTPLEFTVTSDKAKNRFRIEIERP
jgi:hypothetical protein